jgi:ubiquinone/menaquinone biosynthesis C-methylase UbiE
MQEENLTQAAERLREEFNRWADAGRGEEMGGEHAAITAGMLAQMEFSPNDKILDIGCGSGWLCGLLADKVPEGQVVGMDVADEMIRLGRKKYADNPRMMFIVAGAEDIPWEDDFFNKVVSVESAYYWPEPAKAFGEIRRVLQPGGTVRILINLFKENIHSHQWRDKLAVATHLLSGEGWCRLMEEAGLEKTSHSRVVDPRPVPDDYQSRWFKDAEQERRFRQEGALLVLGRKGGDPGWLQRAARRGRGPANGA